MTRGGLIRAGIRHHRRTHAGVAIGTAIAAAVLVGALAVGDSVRFTLERQATRRTGVAASAMVSGDRFFRDTLAGVIADTTGAPAAAAIILPGLAGTPDGTRRARDVELLGVDEAFFTLGPGARPASLPGPDEVLLNDRLAARLDAGVGDRVVLRVHLPSVLPREALLAETQDVTANVSVTVRGVVGPEAFGHFGLRASQVPPLVAFVSRSWLQEEIEQPGRANLLLSAADAGRFEAALDERWTLEDAQLAVRVAPDGATELVSSRIFLDPLVAEAARALGRPAGGILTYFVNEIRHGERATPYSMVTAAGALVGGPDSMLWTSIVAAQTGAGGIMINEWLAEDLGVGQGDEVTLTYFAVADGRVLDERSATFHVTTRVHMSDFAADRTLMPEFPGIADAESSRDWEPSIPIDLTRIRDKDEAYWQDHRGTPKAFIALDAGQSLWSNRFGSLTAVRWARVDADTIAAELRAELDPAQVGLSVTNFRAGDARVTTDFGGLFIGLSLFLVVAALVLTVLLFTLGAEQRAAEIGTLLAVGWRPAQVGRVLLAEAAVIAMIGAVLGTGVGLLYTRAVLLGLATIWRDAVGDADFGFAVTGLSLGIGLIGSVAAALAAIWRSVRRQVRLPVTRLLAGGGTQEQAVRRGRVAPVVAVLGVIGAVVIVFATGRDRGPAAAGAFFGAGTLLLVAGLAAGRAMLGRLATRRGASRLSVGRLGLRAAVRRPGRSLATMTLLACGCFLVVAVGANRIDGSVDASRRDTGTGGFGVWGTTTLPVVQDLDDPAARETLALDGDTLAGVEIVAMRVNDGDEASCLNLAVTPNPRLVGVDPDALARREAFAFAQVTGDPDASPWTLLADRDDHAIPAIGDQASVMWALHKRVGDTIEYRDGRGNPFEVRIVATLAGSMLQGNLLIDESRFLELYPSQSGYGAFLVDASPERVDAVAASLNRALSDLGAEFIPAVERLSEFTAVQNTYLAIFQVLGGLGLLLGSGGLAMVVLRNVLERRGELALLSAVGLPRRSIRRLVMSEHLLLLAAGLAIGTVAAAVAVVPALRSPGTQVPYGSTAILLVLVGVAGVLWVAVATRLALRGKMMGALRDE